MTYPPIPVDASADARGAMALYDDGLDPATLEQYRALAKAVNDEGPECVFCGQRGLNCGRFAQPIPSSPRHAHIGCEADYHRDLEKDRVLDGPDGPW